MSPMIGCTSQGINTSNMACAYLERNVAQWNEIYAKDYSHELWYVSIEWATSVMTSQHWPMSDDTIQFLHASNMECVHWLDDFSLHMHIILVTSVIAWIHCSHDIGQRHETSSKACTDLAFPTRIVKLRHSTTCTASQGLRASNIACAHQLG